MAPVSKISSLFTPTKLGVAQVARLVVVDRVARLRAT